MDRLANRLNLDPAELRRRNLIQHAQMPYDTGFPSGRQTVGYDSGDYPRLLETVLGTIGYDELRRQQKERRDGKLLGLGVARCGQSSGSGAGGRARVHRDTAGTAYRFIRARPR